MGDNCWVLASSSASGGSVAGLDSGIVLFDPFWVVVEYGGVYCGLADGVTE